MMNLFEQALRKQLRFSSDRGELTTEQVMSLDIGAVDTIAMSVNASIESSSSKSFIADRKNTAQADNELRLEVLKRIIEMKQDESDAAKNRIEKAEKRKRLVDALGKREDADLESKSQKQLLKELEALDAE